MPAESGSLLLSAAAASAIGDPQNRVLISVAVLWESRMFIAPASSCYPSTIEMRLIGATLASTSQPTIHPGFGEKTDDANFPGAQIYLEIWNIGPLKIRLKKGMPICQIVFEEVHGVPEGPYAGQFALQGPS